MYIVRFVRQGHEVEDRKVSCPIYGMFRTEKAAQACAEKLNKNHKDYKPYEVVKK